MYCNNINKHEHQLTITALPYCKVLPKYSIMHQQQMKCFVIVNIPLI